MFEIDHNFVPGDTVFTVDPLTYSINKGEVSGLLLTSYRKDDTLSTSISYFVIIPAKKTGHYVEETDLYATFEEAIASLYPTSTGEDTPDTP